MKKYGKVFAGLLLALCCVGVFAACGGGSVGGNSSENAILGKWQVSSISIGGMEYKVGETTTGMVVSADMMTFEFKSDQTCNMGTKIGAASMNFQGTWEEKDGGYSVTANNVTYDLKFENNVLSLTQSGITYHFKK